MIGPSWLAGVFAVVVAAAAVFSAGRLIASRGRRRPGEVDADGVHILMGIAMTGMLVPRLAILPTPAWEVIFAAGAGWFGWRAAQVRGGPARLSGSCCRYPVPHLVDCAAMLYALWAVPVLRPAAAPATDGLTGMAGAAAGVRLPALGLVLAVCICGYVVWLGDRLPSPALARAVATVRDPAAGTLAVRPLLAPRVAACCKIAMGVAMGVMLIDLL